MLNLPASQAAGIYSFDAIGAMLNYKIDRAYVQRHREQFRAVREMLCDELSQKTYAAFISSKLGGDTGPLYDVWSRDQYFPEGIIGLSDREVFVDGGAYSGGSVLLPVFI